MRTEVVCVQEVVVKRHIFTDRTEGCFDTNKFQRSDFRSVLPADFPWPHTKHSREEEHNRRRSIRNGSGRKLFLGGSDPTLSGLAAAQRQGRRGALPPKLSSNFRRSVPGRNAGEASGTAESD